MREVPTFAVVGRVNKGKSSIVSTFVEDESIEIDKAPGTTRACAVYELRVNDRTLCRIVDTPGFEDAARALEWMREHAGSAAERREAVRRFVATFSGGDDFREECELLAPILHGASILYVVDASRPYRPNYEAEMEILRWTGRPRMALINTIDAGDHVDAWRTALDQYFSIVRVFDAHDATFRDRIGLLKAFRQIVDEAREGIEEAIAALELDWERRRVAAARQIAELLVESLTLTIEKTIGDTDEVEAKKKAWSTELREVLRLREQAERRAVETLYRHDRLARNEEGLDTPIHEQDLFSTEGWRVLGLDTWQLVRAGAVGGAAVGAIVDAGSGGASLLAGSLIGGIVGGVSSYYGARTVAQAEIFGIRLGGRVARIGPVRNPRFAWLLLDRALLHYRAVALRAHGRRDPLVIGGDGTRQGLVAKLDTAVQTRLTKLFDRLARQRNEETCRDELSEMLLPILASLEDDALAD